MKFLYKQRLFLFVVLLPFFAAIIYYSSLAVDRYVTASQVVVRQSQSDTAQSVPGLALLMGGVNPSSREETLYLREYVRSADMLAVLNESLAWKKHFSEQRKDWLYAIGSDISNEDLLKLYQKLVIANYDEVTGLLHIEVEAFTPEFSKVVANEILKESERFINEISNKMARDQVAFAERELQNARILYESRRESLIKFQNSNSLLDAEQSAKSRAEIIARIEAEISEQRALLTQLSATLPASSPQIRQQRNKIAAIEQQLKSENSRLVSGQLGGQLNVVANEYRNLTIQSQVAEEAYRLSISAVENARVEANKKIRSLVVVVSPNLPDEAIYPRTIYNLFTILILLLALYGILRFVVMAINDHRD